MKNIFIFEIGHSLKTILINLLPLSILFSIESASVAISTVTPQLRCWYVEIFWSVLNNDSYEIIERIQIRVV